MEKYNLIKRMNRVFPNYHVEDKEISFDLYISPDEKVCIIGKLDNNYICWCSVTKISDVKTNTKIFNYITNLKKKKISNKYNALGRRYEEVRDWHLMHMYKEENQARYYSPASSVYFSDAKFFAGQIRLFFNQERAKCDYRLIDNTYITLLKKYRDMLQKEHQDYTYYEEMKPIIKILEDENYIKLCPDPEVRQLYLDCVHEGNNLYNRYMTAVR